LQEITLDYDEILFLYNIMKTILLENIRSAYNVWERNVNLRRFDSTEQAFYEAKKLWFQLLASEITDKAIPLDQFSSSSENILIVFGNEIYGVEKKTLDAVDKIIYIPMKWIKKSMNIGQSAAIMMRWLN